MGRFYSGFSWSYDDSVLPDVVHGGEVHLGGSTWAACEYGQRW